MPKSSQNIAKQAVVYHAVSILSAKKSLFRLFVAILGRGSFGDGLLDEVAAVLRRTLVRLSQWSARALPVHPQVNIRGLL
jgi:hypothetical protein